MRSLVRIEDRDAVRLGKRPVAFCIRTPNEIDLFFTEEAARISADRIGIEYQGLYVRDGTPLTETEADRDAVIEECAITALEQRCVRGTHWDLACVTIAAAIRALQTQPARPPADRDAVIEECLGEALKQVQRTHDDCLVKAQEVDDGARKSKMGASHYRDQAIGLSHALDILGNLRPSHRALRSQPARPNAEGE
jgi:hypothetical protein